MTSPALTTSLSLARDTYRDIELYAPDRKPARVDLSDNTNRHGMPPAASEAIRTVDAEAITRYPSLYADELKQAIATYAGVPSECIVTGCGSDDVLDSAIRAFAEPGDVIAFPSPTFPMIPIFARMNGLRPVAVPYARNFEIEVDALIDSGARIVYVCSPNNPTGTRASPESIERLTASAPGLVILDEAYVEYDGQGFARQAATSQRLFVTRTLSKAFGLAGLRVGYGIGAPALVAEVEKSRGPYKVNAIAQRAAVAALSEGLPWVHARVADDIASRDRLGGELRKLGLTPIPSRANFVLVPVRQSARIAASMRELGVAVRPFSQLPGVGDALRISVGPWDMVDECLRALRSVLRGITT